MVSNFPALSGVKKDPFSLQKIQVRFGVFFPSWSMQMKVIDVKLFSLSAMLLPIFPISVRYLMECFKSRKI